jgi:hypothetical protein
MTRKAALHWIRLATAAATWTVAGWIAEDAVGSELGIPGHDMEERIELQLRGRGGPAVTPEQPPRTHDDSFEPWELVSV